MHTQTGAQVAKKVVNYASPKDRKLIAKALKGFVVKAAMDQYGHLFIIRFLETTDDTTLSKKAIIEVLMQNTLIHQNIFPFFVLLHVTKYLF